MMPVIPDSRVGDRFVAVFMTVTLVLFAALVGLIVYLVIRVSNVQGDQHNATISSCQQSNASRTEDIEIWEAVLKLPPDATAEFITPANMAAQNAAVAKVKAKVREADALRNCAAAAG
jgi:L-cystine uptake protein TcyP (sodium:dicarboxylate symporter family)